MKKFKFSLQKVLEYRAHIENKEAESLAILYQELHEIEKQKKGLKRKSELYRMALLNDCREGVCIVTAVFMSNYIKELIEQIKLLNKRIAEKNTEVDKQTQKLIEATKSKKIIEKLRENKLDSYNSEERKSEEHFIEEFISYINSTAV